MRVIGKEHDMTNDRIEAKLRELRAEYEAGQKMLAELDARRSALTSTMLRIDGAIQVLVELAAPEGTESRATERAI
jgi:hypothetical protein